MNVVAIVGSHRKGKVTDALVDKAVEGVLVRSPNVFVHKINLIDHDIKYCQNCLTCRGSKTVEPFAKCVIRDDMDTIFPVLVQSDAVIFGTPVHMGSATAVSVAFLERICWTFSKPERTILTIKGCPMPRSIKQRKAVIIVASGLVPPMFRRFCDFATPLIRNTLRDTLNARTVGSMYAGAVENKGIQRYLGKAFHLGEKLSKSMQG